MATVTIVTCTGCGNIILPGDIIAITTKGILSGTEGSIDIEEVEGSRPVHFCDDCATRTAEEMNGLIASAEERDDTPPMCGTDCTGACAD